MNQRSYRVLYLLLGLAPATFAALSAFSIGMPSFWSGSSLAICGFLYAVFAAFPVKERTFRYAALFLCIGVGFVVTLSVIALTGAVKAITSGAVVPNGATVLWILGWVVALIGPAFSAVHFLRFGRRTPDNSSKPTPLRGAA